VKGLFTNLQDGCILHADPGYPAVVGDDCVVGHRAVVHGCEIGDGCLVGMGATILNGAKIGEGSIVAAGALVPEKRLNRRGRLSGLDWAGVFLWSSPPRSSGEGRDYEPIYVEAVATARGARREG
jgi:carbonic anhydrase/acetyltransferase-like protein (isoleucine patch superfamily)